MPGLSGHNQTMNAMTMPIDFPFTVKTCTGATLGTIENMREGFALCESAAPGKPVPMIATPTVYAEFLESIGFICEPIKVNTQEPTA